MMRGVNEWDERAELRVQGYPRTDLTVLVETNLAGALTEALTADVEAVLADDTALVGADTAMARNESGRCKHAGREGQYTARANVCSAHHRHKT